MNLIPHNSLKMLCSAFSLVMLISCASQAQLTSVLRQETEWRFHVQNGEIGVRLSYLPAPQNSREKQHFSSLSIWAIEPIPLPPDTKLPSVQEEAEVLSKVLKAMLSLGYDLHSLERINTPLSLSELGEGANKVVAKTDLWKVCSQKKHCQEAAGVINQYLKSVNAYKEFDEVLRPYGLTSKLSGVDEPDVWKEEDSQGASQNKTPKSIKIVCDGLIEIAVEKQQDGAKRDGL